MQKSSKLLQNPLLVSLTFLVLEGSVYAKPNDTQTLAVPVLFATTRRVDDHNQFSGFRNFQHKDHEIIYGLASVQIESSHLLDDKLKALGCSIPDKKGKTINFQTFDNESAFQKDIREKLNQPQNKEVCFFVHGYNNGFGDSLENAARLMTPLQEKTLAVSAIQHLLNVSSTT